MDAPKVAFRLREIWCANQRELEPATIGEIRVRGFSSWQNLRSSASLDGRAAQPRGPTGGAAGFLRLIVTTTPFPVIFRETMPDSEQRTSQAQTQVFPHTRWSVVLAATHQPSPEAEAALETICRAYWYPLYA